MRERLDMLLDRLAGHERRADAVMLAIFAALLIALLLGVMP